MNMNAEGPLAGQRVVVTRPVHQAQALARPLRDRGASVILLPTVEIAPPPDIGPLQQAAMNLNAYQWVVFTSSNAVDALMSQVRGMEIPPAMPLIAAIGAATRSTVEAYGLSVAVVSKQSNSESLAAAFEGQSLVRAQVLLPCAVVTRDVLPGALRDQGATVHVVPAYQNVVPEQTLRAAREVFREPMPDWVTFTSPSAVAHLVAVTGRDLLQTARIATIGRITSAAVQAQGLTVQAEATLQTAESLVEALVLASRL